MKYEQAQHLKPGEFKRLWGVKLETFEHMVEIVQQQERQKKKAFGLVSQTISKIDD
jgi:hypothetical protein